MPVQEIRYPLHSQQLIEWQWRPFWYNSFSNNYLA